MDALRCTRRTVDARPGLAINPPDAFRISPRALEAEERPRALPAQRPLRRHVDEKPIEPRHRRRYAAGV